MVLSLLFGVNGTIGHGGIQDSKTQKEEMNAETDRYL
jgi:hypothetical protein